MAAYIKILVLLIRWAFHSDTPASKSPHTVATVSLHPPPPTSPFTAPTSSPSPGLPFTACCDPSRTSRSPQQTLGVRSGSGVQRATRSAPLAAQRGALTRFYNCLLLASRAGSSSVWCWHRLERKNRERCVLLNSQWLETGPCFTWLFLARRTPTHLPLLNVSFLSCERSCFFYFGGHSTCYKHLLSKSMITTLTYMTMLWEFFQFSIPVS